MKYTANDINDGSLNGKDIWICAYQFNDVRHKPIRHLKPQKVKVFRDLKIINYYLDKTLTRYYKNGELNEKYKFKIYDNTSYPSVLDMFDTETECIEFYITKSREVRDIYKHQLYLIINQIDTLDSTIIKYQSFL